MENNLNNTADWLKTFSLRIVSGSPKAYGNGRQQIAVRLSVEPKDGQVVSPEQFKTLTVVIEESPGIYSPLSKDSSEDWFYTVTHDPSLDFYPDSLSELTDADHPQTAALSKVIYIHTTAPANSKITLRGCIEKDPKTRCYTDDHFDTKIELQSVSAPPSGHQDDERREITSTVLFDEISHFQVMGLGSSNDNVSCPLYSNGYQQTYVKIVIEAKRNGIPVTIGSLINTVELIDYNTGQKLPSSYTYSLSQTAIDKLFLLYDGISSPAEVQVKKGESKTIWIKTTSTTNIKIAARLEYNGNVYHTHDRTLTPGGATVSGKSNSSAFITPIQQNYFIRSNGFKTLRTDHNNGPTWDIDTYQFWFNNDNYRIVYAFEPNDTANHLFSQDYVDKKVSNLLFYFRPGAERIVNIGYAHEDYFIRINQTSNRAYAVRNKAKWGLGPGNEFIGSTRVTYLDQYGNHHTVMLIPGGLANTMHLGDA